MRRGPLYLAAALINHWTALDEKVSKRLYVADVPVVPF